MNAAFYLTSPDTPTLKAQTGFSMYALREDAARLRPAMSDPEIMLDILSL
jgi:hypothetical protein